VIDFYIVCLIAYQRLIGRQENLCNVELHNLYSPQNVGVIKPKMMNTMGAVKMEVKF
jgi:hypothetical protein